MELTGTRKLLEVYCIPVNDRVPDESELAKNIRKRYPEAYRKYKDRISPFWVKNRGNVAFSFTHDKKVIVWMFCIIHGFNQIDYHAFQWCLDDLIKVLPNRNGTIAFPLDGLSMADRRQLEPVIQAFSRYTTLNILTDLRGLDELEISYRE